jgi:hypothetical protein
MLQPPHGTEVGGGQGPTVQHGTLEHAAVVSSDRLKHARMWAPDMQLLGAWLWQVHDCPINCSAAHCKSSLFPPTPAFLTACCKLSDTTLPCLLAPPPCPPPPQVFLSNIPHEASDEEVKAFASQAGEVSPS